VPEPAYGWLAGELAAVRGELSRTDAKCGVLTAVTTGAAALAAAGASGHMPVAARVVFAAATAVLAAALLVLLAALRPRLGTAGWCRYLRMPAAQLHHLTSHGYTDLTPSRRVYPPDLQMEDLTALAGITAGKYRLIGRAVWLLSAGLVMLGAGVLTGVIV
jgi:Family of unknown function (DUF5706)